MPGESASARQNVEQALDELARLRQFLGPAPEFWPPFLDAIQRLTGADQLTLLVRKAGQPWRRLMDWPKDPAPSRMLTAFFSQSSDFADRTLAAGAAFTAVLDPTDGPGAGNFLIGARLRLAQDDDCALLGVISEVSEATAREAAFRLALAGDVPSSYQRALAAVQAKADIEKLASVLDLTASVSDEKQFLPTALTFCNGLATRFACDRVSLGWLVRGWVRLSAISRTEQFDRQMAAAQALEVAMEEALDQNEEIVWPAPTGASVVARDHERFSKQHQAAYVCSVPLRRDGAPVAVITCERNTAPFTESELQQLRLACDLAAPRLGTLKDSDRWFGARWADHLRGHLAKLIGPEHTWAKLAAIGIVILLAVLFFLRVPYRVEGTFILRSDHLVYLASPYDGYIDQASVRPGDVVKAGDPLLKLKTEEMELEESYALADLNRYQRESEKARAAKLLPEMRIAEAMAKQATARLEGVRHRLQQASIRSPFAGVVIEGDLRDRIGSPVKTADVLMKVAQIDTLFVEAEINERDVHEVLGQEGGEIAFVAQPKYTFPIRITTVEQAAMSKPDGNVFLVRCALEQRPEPWWRPGMSGICKINVGRRALWWILTHRTVDFLRLKLWW
jgi:hypothetical protein